MWTPKIKPFSFFSTEIASSKSLESSPSIVIMICLVKSNLPFLSLSETVDGILSKHSITFAGNSVSIPAFSITAFSAVLTSFSCFTISTITPSGFLSNG